MSSTITDAVYEIIKNNSQGLSIDELEKILLTNYKPRFNTFDVRDAVWCLVDSEKVQFIYGRKIILKGLETDRPKGMEVSRDSFSNLLTFGFALTTKHYCYELKEFLEKGIVVLAYESGQSADVKVRVVGRQVEDGQELFILMQF